jgi:hypothetical protein
MSKKWPALDNDFNDLKGLMYYNSTSGDPDYLYIGKGKWPDGEPTKMTKQNSLKLYSAIIDSNIPLTPQFLQRIIDSDIPKHHKIKAMVHTITTNEYNGVHLHNSQFINRLNNIGVKYVGSTIDDSKSVEEAMFVIEEFRNYNKDQIDEVGKIIGEEVLQTTPQTPPQTTPQKDQPMDPESPEEFYSPYQTSQFVNDARNELYGITSDEEAQMKIAQYEQRLAEIELDETTGEELEPSIKALYSVEKNELMEKIWFIENRKELEEAIDPITSFGTNENKIKRIIDSAKKGKRLEPASLSESEKKALQIIGMIKNPSVSREEVLNVLSDNPFVRIDNEDELMNKYKPEGFIPKSPEPEPVSNQQEQTDPQAQQQPQPQANFGTVVDQVDKIVYHKDAILLMYNDDKNPEWDLELENTIKNSKFSKEFMLKASKSIIDNYGSKIFVYELKTDGSLQEFLELIQLQYSFERGYLKGSRSKNALVSIKDLTNFSNSLLGQGQTTTITTNNDITPINGVEEALKNTPNAPSVPSGSVVQVTLDEAKQQVRDATEAFLKKNTLMGIPIQTVKYRPIPTSFNLRNNSRDYLNIQPVIKNIGKS